MKRYSVVLRTGSDWIAVSRVYHISEGDKTTLCTEYDVRETLTEDEALERCAAFRKQFPDERFDIYLNGSLYKGKVSNP